MSSTPVSLSMLDSALLLSLDGYNSEKEAVACTLDMLQDPETTGMQAKAALRRLEDLKLVAMFDDVPRVTDRGNRALRSFQERLSRIQARLIVR